MEGTWVEINWDHIRKGLQDVSMRRYCVWARAFRDAFPDDDVAVDDHSGLYAYIDFEIYPGDRIRFELTGDALNEYFKVRRDPTSVRPVEVLMPPRNTDDRTISVIRVAA